MYAKTIQAPIKLSIKYFPVRNKRASRIFIRVLLTLPINVQYVIWAYVSMSDHTQSL